MKWWAKEKKALKLRATEKALRSKKRKQTKQARAKYRVFTLKHSKSYWANESRSDGAEMKYQC